MPWNDILMLLAVLALGCEPTATYHFGVVDAETGKPLEHVRVTEWWQGSHWSNRLFDDTGEKELKPTGADGATVATGVIQGDFQYRFWFESGGYKYLTATAGGGSDPWIFSYADAPVGLVGVKTINVWVPKNSEIRVPMYRLGGKPTQLTPVSQPAERVYPDQMGSLSAEERRAISLATAALRQRNALRADDEHLAFHVARSDTGWEVYVYPFSRDVPSSRPLFTLGNFVVVAISRSWKVVRITGGA